MQFWNNFLAKKLHICFVGPFHFKLAISNEMGFQSTCSQQFHGIIEWLALEGTLKLSSPPCPAMGR